MNKRVVGAVSNRTPQVASYKLSATSVQPPKTIQVAVPPLTPVSPPRLVTVDGIATSVDNPGMPPFPVRAFFIQAQTDAIKSAAKNTATAFGLNPTTAADKAVIVVNNLFRKELAAVPAISDSTTTTVIIPP